MTPVTDANVIERLSPRRTISRRRRAAFAFAIGLVLFAFQEFLFRVAFPFPEVMKFSRDRYAKLFLSERRQEQADRDGTRNVIVRVASDPDGYEFDHRLNLYGFRGPNFRLRPPSDRARVIFVGDSFVEGMGAADGDTISAQFARIIETARKAEAINLGVSGIGLAEYTRLVRDGLQFLRPNSVFVVIYANDLPAHPYPSELDGPAMADSARNPWIPRVVEVVDRLWRGLAVPRFFPSGPFPYFEAVPSLSNPLTTSKPLVGVDPEILDAMKRGRANPTLVAAAELFEERLRHDFAKSGDTTPYLARMKQLCKDRGAALTIAYIPYAPSVNTVYLHAQKRLGTKQLADLSSLSDPRYRTQQKHLSEVTRRLEIPFLDLSDSLAQAEARGTRCFWPIDGHCTAAGYRLIAEECARRWEARVAP
jgi:lysophospholipase L1-like esterase